MRSGTAARPRHERRASRRCRRRAAVSHRDRRWPAARRRRARGTRARAARASSSATRMSRRLYATRVADALQAARPDLRCNVSCIPAGESAKTLARFGELRARAGRLRRDPRCVRDRARRRRGRRPGRLRRRMLDARHRFRATADHLARDGRFLGRRQDGGRHAAGQEPRRRIPSAARGVRRYRRRCARCRRSRVARRPGRSGEVRRDPRCAASSNGSTHMRALARARRRCAGRGHRAQLRAQGGDRRARSASSAASARCSTSATRSRTRSRPSRATAV